MIAVALEWQGLGTRPLTIIALLAQVETLLKGQESDPAQRTSPLQPQDNAFTAPLPDESILALPEISGLGTDMGSAIPQSTTGMETSQPSQTFFQGAATFPSDPQWDLISLGLEEPLPTQDAIDELWVNHEVVSSSLL